MEIVAMIIYGFIMFGLGVAWLYQIQDKIEEPPKSSIPIKNLPSVIIEDIELGSIRYYLKGDKVSPIRVDGLISKEGSIYIQQIESDGDLLDRITLERHPAFEGLKYVKIYDFYQKHICIEGVPVDSDKEINSAKAILIEKHRSINLQLKLSETFETEDEAKQILLSKLDNQFDNELQLLQDKYNKQLDTLI